MTMGKLNYFIRCNLMYQQTKQKIAIANAPKMPGCSLNNHLIYKIVLRREFVRKRNDFQLNLAIDLGAVQFKLQGMDLEFLSPKRAILII